MTESDVVEPANAAEIGTPLSLAAARSLCTEALREVRAGTDPAEAKQAARRQEHAAEAQTLQAVCEKHLKLEAGNGPAHAR